MRYIKEDSDLRSERLAAGLFNRGELEWHTKFYRFGCLNPCNQITRTREYLFFTRPDLHLMDNSGNFNKELIGNTYLTQAYKEYRDVFNQLQSSVSPNYPFMNILSASVSSSLDLGSSELNEVDTAATSYGDSIKYIGNTLQSEESGYNFSLEFLDDKYREVYNLFKIYSTYEDEKSKGTVTPPDHNKYTFNRTIHDQFCIFKIIVEEDYETILHYERVIGCYPKTVPKDAFTNMDSLTEGIKYSINFHGQWADDNDPEIIIHFNSLVKDKFTGYDEMPLYDVNKGHVIGDMCHIPYITYQKTLGASPVKGRYKLRWR